MTILLFCVLFLFAFSNKGGYHADVAVPDTLSDDTNGVVCGGGGQKACAINHTFNCLFNIQADIEIQLLAPLRIRCKKVFYNELSHYVN